MKIVATSDLHGQLPPIESLPECDVFIIAGDIAPDLPSKKEKYDFVDSGAAAQSLWLQDHFAPWVDAIPAEKVLYIAGNHDFVFEQYHPLRDLALPGVYLQDTGIEIDGVSFWGTPWVPGLPRWAFYANPTLEEALWESVQPDIDVLISHGPPRGLLDTVPGGGKYANRYDEDVGSVEFARNLPRITPKRVVCGHIHEGYGLIGLEGFGTVVHNVAYVDGDYVAGKQPPQVFEV